MKRCEYCGKQYSDYVTTCPADGRPTLNPEEKLRPESVSSEDQPAFEAKVVSPLSLAGAYRIFICGSDILFIKTDAPTSHVFALIGSFMGPLGGFAVLFDWLISRGKRKDHQKQLHTAKPEHMFRDDGQNFKLNQAEIRDAAVEPIKYIAKSGKAGRLVFTVRHGEKIKLEFDSTDEMAKAIQLLTGTLQPALNINRPETEAAKAKTV